MDQAARRGLKFFRDIKSVAFATVNSGEPAVRIADGILAEEDGLYFLTARGKPCYRQLTDNLKLAVCGMNDK